MNDNDDNDGTDEARRQTTKTDHEDRPTKLITDSLERESQPPHTDAQVSLTVLLQTSPSAHVGRQHAVGGAGGGNSEELVRRRPRRHIRT